jgi:hypothetical protein
VECGVWSVSVECGMGVWSGCVEWMQQERVSEVAKLAIDLKLLKCMPTCQDHVQISCNLF